MALWNVAKRDGRDLSVGTVYGPAGNRGREDDVVGRGREWLKAVTAKSEDGSPLPGSLCIRVVSGDGPAIPASGHTLILHTMAVWRSGAELGESSVSAFYDIPVANLGSITPTEGTGGGEPTAQIAAELYGARWSFRYLGEEVQPGSGEAEYLCDVVGQLKALEPDGAAMLRAQLSGNTPCFSDLEAVLRWITAA